MRHHFSKTIYFAFVFWSGRERKETMEGKKAGMALIDTITNGFRKCADSCAFLPIHHIHVCYQNS